MNQPTQNPPAVRNPFGESITAPAGASANALAQREVAEIQGALLIAQRFPRNPVQAMDRILAACCRPSLAEHATYQYNRGGVEVTGASIRLAEEMARSWGNVLSGLSELSRSDGYSEVLAYAWDLETNFRDEKRFQVKHWRDTKNGGYKLTEERDIYETIANAGARRKRSCILAIIPEDVQEAALEQCEATLKAKVDVTPLRIKSLTDGFAEFGVSLAQLEARLGRRVDSITPAGVLQLRKIYTSLRDGLSTPEQWFPPLPPPAKKAAVKAKGKDDDPAPKP